MSPFLTPVSLCLFDKNLKGERVAIREKLVEVAGSQGHGHLSADKAWLTSLEMSHTKAPLTSLRMIHTGESVWMDSLMASSGPKEGSTSPSATPLEKEPGGESTWVTWGGLLCPTFGVLVCFF